jgi:negative regulator of sigma E activity
MVDMNTQMNTSAIASNAPDTATREQISRWLDGDIASNEIDLAMKVLSQEEGRYCWAEMHFVGDCIRGLENTPVGCADRIRTALASEPAIIAPAGKRLREEKAIKERGLFSAMTSMGRGGRAWATAAAVAAVGFVGTVVYKDQTAAPQIAIAPSVGASALASNAPTSKPNADFNAYLRAHQESADISSLSPMRQYMRPAVIVQAP